MGQGPSQQAAQFGPQALEYFQRIGVVLDRHGLPQVTPATYSLMQVDRLRQANIARTQHRMPSAPKYLFPDAMGKGVTRNAWGEPLTDRHLRQYGRKAPVAVKARYACVSQVSSGCELIRGTKRNQDGAQAGVRVVHKDWSRDEPTPKGFERYIRRGEDMLETPFEGDAIAPPVLSLQQLVQGFYGDIFDLNRGVIEPVRRGGEIMGFRPGDGGIIIPAWETVRRWTGYYGTTTVDGRDITTLSAIDKSDAVSADIRARMRKEGFEDPGVDLTDPTVEWVVYRDGIVDGSFRRGELIVLPMMTSTDIEYAGHPPSYLQLGMEFAAMSWTIHDYHGRKFTDAAWNSMILAIIGEGYDDEGFNEFLNSYREGVKGYQRAAKPFMVHLPEGGDLRSVDTRPPVADAEFKMLEERVESGFCAIIRRHPEIINGTTPSANGPRLNGPSEELRIRISKEEGQCTDVRHAAAYLSRALRMAVHDDIRVVPVFPAADRGAMIEVLNKEIENLKTVNEGAVETGLEPMGFYLSRADFNKASDEDRKRFLENPYNYPTNPQHMERQKFVMGLNKGTDDAQQPAPKLNADGKLIPQKEVPMTFDHAPGMGATKGEKDGDAAPGS